MNRWLRNQILKQRKLLILKKGKNLIISNSILEGNIRLGDDIEINNCILKGKVIDINSSLENCTVIGNVIIDKYCAIGDDVLFQGLNHSTNRPCMQMRFYKKMTGEDLPVTCKGPIRIRNDVWIGSRATILSGVEVGDGAIIGTGAIVTKNVEPYSIVVGVPAKHIKYRFPKHIREQLLEIKWWGWSNYQMELNKDFFKKDLTNVKDVKKFVEEAE